MKQFMLPLWRQVVFVDWHGVLSNDIFWKSILANRRHPLRSQLEKKLAGIFASDQPTLHEWMKGLRSSAEIISAMHIQLPPRFKQDYLHRRLAADCRRMKVNVGLLEILQMYLSKAFVVVATDNMDCTVSAFEDLRKRTFRRESAPDTLAAWAAWCDDIVCSSDVGKLKGEDPEAFFGPWLSAHGLTFTEALLIDDRADNCEAFVLAGGAAIQWKLGSNHISELVKPLERWFESTSERSRRSVGDL